MAAVLNEHGVAVVELGQEPQPSSYLADLWDEIERTRIRHDEASQRLAIVTGPVPRPFAYD
jgi:hypothetical protein